MATAFPERSVQYWLEMLRDHSIKRRRQAVEALGAIGYPAVIGIVRFYRDGRSADRYWALRALERIGPHARDAIPVIKVALKSEHPEIRAAARAALENIDPKAAGQVLGFWYRVRRWIRRHGLIRRRHAT